MPGSSDPVVVFTGYITKRGALIKNWKKRYFVIKSNGACDYFAKEGEAKPKGSIVLEGYIVNSEPKTDIFAGKDHFFTCEHYDDGKRVWYLHVESAEEKVKAVASFTQAVRVAQGYVNPDKVAGAAFKKAYASLRHAYGLISKNPRGTEEEALGDLLYDRLYQVVVSDVVRDLQGPAKSVAIKAAKTLTSGLVSVSWKALDEAAGKVRPTVEETLKKAMAPFVENENKLKEKIQEQGLRPIFFFFLLFVLWLFLTFS